MRFMISRLVLAICAGWSPVMATISFGSRKSALEVSAGSLAFTENGVGLTKGTLRKTGAGNFSGETGESLTCAQMRIETDHSTTQKGMHVDGSLSLFDATLTLGNNEILTVDGGQVAETVTANGAASTPSVIRGNGSFASGLSVNATRELVIRWEGELSQDLTLTSSVAGTTKVTLEHDLRFAHGYSVEASSETGTAEVDFNNFAMTVGEVTIGTNNQQWRDAWLKLSGDTTISADVTLVGNAAHIEGHGHTLSLTGATAGSVGGTIINTTLGNFDSGVLAGTGTWNLVNTTLDDGTQKIKVLSGALTGGTADVFAGAATWESASELELLSDTEISGEWTFSGASAIKGNKKTLNFGSTSSIIDIDATVTIHDVVLTNIVKESFDNGDAQDLHLNNVEWHDAISNSGGSIRISASPVVASARYAQLSLASGSAGEDGALFDDTTGDTDRIVWNNGVGIDLMNNVDLNTTWTFDGASAINGHGYALNLEGGTLDYNADLYLSDIALVGVDAAAFDNELGQDLYLSNVVWMDDTNEGALHIIGNTTVSEHNAAQVSLATSNSGNLFATAVTWDTGVTIELLKGVTFNSGAAWTFSGNTCISGNGNMIDFNSVATPVTIAAGKTLTIANAVIAGWGNGEISFGAGATLELSDVTIIMDGDYSTDLTGETIRINGNVRFITGGYTFDASSGTNEVNGVTVYYDSLGRQDNGYVKLGSFTGGGRVVMQPLSPWQPLLFDSSSHHVTDSLFLNYDVDASSDGVVEALGRNITFDTSTAFTLQGGGRSLYMGNVPSSDATSTKLIAVSGANIVELEDLTLVGWNENHISDGSGLIRYGNGCVLRLTSDQTLTSAIHVSNASSGDTVVLDLNGHTLDMDSDDASFSLAATNVNFIIKNGRIMNLNDNGVSTKFIMAGFTPTVTFQDVEIVMNGATRLLSNDFVFKGNCKITGTGDNTLSFYGPDITIAAGAHLTIDKGITMELIAAATMTFGSANATLEFFGATFDVTSASSPPALTTGTILIDDKVTFAGDMTLGGSGASNLDIILQPAASLEVSSGTITYSNDS